MDATLEKIAFYRGYRKEMMKCATYIEGFVKEAAKSGTPYSLQDALLYGALPGAAVMGIKELLSDKEDEEKRYLENMLLGGLMGGGLQSGYQFLPEKYKFLSGLGAGNGDDKADSGKLEKKDLEQKPSQLPPDQQEDADQKAYQAWLLGELSDPPPTHMKIDPATQYLKGGKGRRLQEFQGMSPAMKFSKAVEAGLPLSYVPKDLREDLSISNEGFARMSEGDRLAFLDLAAKESGLTREQYIEFKRKINTQYPSTGPIFEDAGVDMKEVGFSSDDLINRETIARQARRFAGVKPTPAAAKTTDSKSGPQTSKPDVVTPKEAPEPKSPYSKSTLDYAKEKGMLPIQLAQQSILKKRMAIPSDPPPPEPKTPQWAPGVAEGSAVLEAKRQQRELQRKQQAQANLEMQRAQDQQVKKIEQARRTKKEQEAGRAAMHSKVKALTSKQRQAEERLRAKNTQVKNQRLKAQQGTVRRQALGKVRKDVPTARPGTRRPIKPTGLFKSPRTPSGR